MNQNPSTTIEHLVLERRLSQISTELTPPPSATLVAAAAASASSGRSPRPGSIQRRRSEMNPSVTVVPMPLNTSASPQNSVLLAPPTHEQLAQRRFSEVNAAIERHNMRKAAKRSQSVMYRNPRRTSVRVTSHPEIPVQQLGRRRKSVKM